MNETITKILTDSTARKGKKAQKMCIRDSNRVFKSESFFAIVVNFFNDNNCMSDDNSKQRQNTNKSWE